MNDKKTTRFPNGLTPSLMAAILLAALMVGALFTWGVATAADRDLRADLLQQTRLVAQAVDLKQVQALSGVAADLDNPDYQRLKDQLAAICSANPQCRFVYLMGRRADGAVFFWVDSEPAGTADYSPPGQVYDEVPAGYRRVFDSGVAAVEGPVSDRWGVWVSALVPLTGPQSGPVAAVLGMDIDASVWQWDVATRAALPVGLMWVLLIGAVAALAAAAPRVEASPRPVLRRLLAPLALILLLLLAGGGGCCGNSTSSKSPGI